MDSQPGPSGIKDPLDTERPKKKLKIEDDDDDVGSPAFSTTINDLPDEMLIDIFKYLSVQERLKAEKVCDRWHPLLKGEVFWKYVNLSDISNSLFAEILVSLPPCVSQLRLVSQFDSLPISLPELLAKLHDRCPSVESVYVGNIHLVKNLHTIPSRPTRRTEFFNSILLEGSKSILDEHSIHIIESEFRKEEDVGSKYATLLQLKVLSLRRVLCNKFHILSHINSFVLPKLVVLDLSYSKPLSTEEFYLFSSLCDLEELYLADWKISDIAILNFIINSHKLRVLDLEHSKVTKKTISALERYCNRLEELYLSFCLIENFSRTVDDQDFFPCLKKLCLKRTEVTPNGVERLITECPSLKFIDVSCSVHIDDIWYSGLSKDLKEKIYFKTDESVYYCDHFSKSKHYTF